MRFKTILASVLLAVMAFPMVASAEPPADAFVYNKWQTAVKSPPMYSVENVYAVKDLGLDDADMVSPQDLYIDRVNDKFYVADSKANTVIRWDIADPAQPEEIYRGVYIPLSYRELRLNKLDDPQNLPEELPEEIKLSADVTVPLFVRETAEGLKFFKFTPFVAPQGVFVAKDKIYVAGMHSINPGKIDATGCVIVMDMEGYLLSVIYAPPESAALSGTFVFQPQKVVVDASDTIYVVAQGGNRGLFRYEAMPAKYMVDEKGREVEQLEGGLFKDFYGANRVQSNVRLLMDLAIKRILPKKYRDKLAVYVPTEISNAFVDEEGFIYAVTTSVIASNVDQIRRLNYHGTNILRYNGQQRNYGELDIARIEGNWQYSQFVDVTVDDRGFISAMDMTNARLFQYDGEANSLIIQGKGRMGSSDQRGTFEFPSSIDNHNRKLWVLDSALKQLTVFRLTEYGENLQEAITLYNQGKYLEAMDYWQEVLKRNGNSELAYTGLGRAYMKQDDFETAMEYLRLGYDRKTYSEVYKQYRGIWAGDHFTLIALAVIALVLSPYVIGKRKKIGAAVGRIFKKGA